MTDGLSLTQGYKFFQAKGAVRTVVVKYNEQQETDSNAIRFNRITGRQRLTLM